MQVILKSGCGIVGCTIFDATFLNMGCFDLKPTVKRIRPPDGFASLGPGAGKLSGDMSIFALRDAAMKLAR